MKYKYTFIWKGKDGRLLSVDRKLTPCEAWEHAEKLYAKENVVQVRAIRHRTVKKLESCG